MVDGDAEILQEDVPPGKRRAGGLKMVLDHDVQNGAVRQNQRHVIRCKGKLVSLETPLAFSAVIRGRQVGQIEAHMEMLQLRRQLRVDMFGLVEHGPATLPVDPCLPEHDAIRLVLHLFPRLSKKKTNSGNW